MDVQMPDGTLIQGVPDGTSKSMLLEKYGKYNAVTQSNPESQISGFEAFTRGMKNMASFGFDDEMRGFGRAVGSKLRGDERPFNELVGHGTNEIRNEYAQAETQHPYATLAGEVTGAVAPAFLPGGAEIASWAGSGNLAARMGKGAATAAIPSAVYGLGSGENTQERLSNAAAYGLGGAALGSAAPLAGSVASNVVQGLGNVKAGIAARGSDALDDAALKLKQTAQKSYAQMREAGAIINSKRAVSISNKIDQAVRQSGKLNERLHGDTLSVLTDLKNATKNGNFGLEDLDQYRQLLGDAISKNTDAIKGANPDARVASIAIDKLDELVEGLNPIDIIGGDTSAVNALKAGRAEWAKYRKFEAVSRIIKQADGNPDRLKSGFKRFIGKPKNLRGFSESEINTLKAAANNNLNDKILKGLGGFGIDFDNKLLPFLGGALTGYGAGPGAGTAMVAAGTAARQGRKFAARGSAEEALKAIESRGSKAIENTTPMAIPSNASLPIINQFLKNEKVK